MKDCEGLESTISPRVCHGHVRGEIGAFWAVVVSRVRIMGHECSRVLGKLFLRVHRATPIAPISSSPTLYNIILSLNNMAMLLFILPPYSLKYRYPLNEDNCVILLHYIRMTVAATMQEAENYWLKIVCDSTKRKMGTEWGQNYRTNNKGLSINCLSPRFYLAGGEEVESPFTESESVVLPLNDPPVVSFCWGVYNKY